MGEGCCVCHSCGRKIEFSQEELPCDVLSGWLMVSHMTGLESVDSYSFCSFSCLKRWVTSQVPEIPEIFLKSLGEETAK
jgi:hypothetical protein